MRRIESLSLSEILLPVLVASVEVATISTLVRLFGPRFWLSAGTTIKAPWPVALGVVGLLAFWSARVLGARGVGLKSGRAISLFMWVGVTVIWLGVQYDAWRLGKDSVNPVSRHFLLLPIGLSLLAWWRGLAYGSDPSPFSSSSLHRMVQIAWVALILEIVTVMTIRGATSHGALRSSQGAVPVAVVCGLLAMAVSRIEEARRTAHQRHGRLPNRAIWLGFAAIATLLIAVIAIAVGGVFGQDTSRLLYAPVVVGLQWLWVVFVYAIFAVAFVLFVIVYPVLWLARFFLHGSSGEQKPSVANPPSFSKYAHAAQEGLSAGQLLAVQWALAIVVAAIVFWIVMAALRRYHENPHKGDVDEQRESLWSRDLALQQLRNVFGRQHQRHPKVERPDLTQQPVSVREVFRHLTILAERKGFGRQSAETATDFATRIRRQWPGIDVPMADLTPRYQRVRYGEMPDEPERTAAQADWREIWRTHEHSGNGAGQVDESQ